MTQQKSPAYQWYPKDILSSARVQEMSLAEEGAYRRLLDYCWLNGNVPADASRCARLIGKGCTNEIASYVLEMFVPDPLDTARMIHERLEVERDKQKQNSEKRKLAAEARWNGRGTPAEARGTQVESRSDDELCKSNANALQMECIAFATSVANKNGGGRARYVKPPPPPVNQPEPVPETLMPPRIGKEPLQDYLLRKQLEYPRLRVHEIYENFRRLCGSERYPRLKNTAPSFDRWLQNQHDEFEALVAPNSNTNTMTDEDAAELIRRKYAKEADGTQTA